MDILLKAVELLVAEEGRQTPLQSTDNDAKDADVRMIFKYASTPETIETQSDQDRFGDKIYKMVDTPPVDHQCDIHCLKMKLVPYTQHQHCIVLDKKDSLCTTDQKNCSQFETTSLPPETPPHTPEPSVSRRPSRTTSMSSQDTSSQESSSSRKHHNLKEKNRRNSIKGLINKMRKMLPTTTSAKGFMETNMAAVAYIKQLKQTTSELEKEKGELAEQCTKLTKKLEFLRTEEMRSLPLRDHQSYVKNFVVDEVIDICSSEDEPEEGEIVNKKRKTMAKKPAATEPETTTRKKWIQLTKIPERRYRIGGRPNINVKGSAEQPLNLSKATHSAPTTALSKRESPKIDETSSGPKRKVALVPTLRVQTQTSKPSKPTTAPSESESPKTDETASGPKTKVSLVPLRVQTATNATDKKTLYFMPAIVVFSEVNNSS